MTDKSDGGGGSGRRGCGFGHRVEHMNLRSEFNRDVGLMLQEEGEAEDVSNIYDTSIYMILYTHTHVCVCMHINI
jgi:hypothetical protein